MKKNFLNEDGSDTRFRIELPEGLKENPTEMQSNPIKDNFWEGIYNFKATDIPAHMFMPINRQMPVNRQNKPETGNPMIATVRKDSSVPVVPPAKSSSKNYLYIGLGIAAIIIGATLVIKNKTI